MRGLQGDAEAHGVLTALGVRLSAITLAGPGLRLSCAGDPDPALEARLVINAAGLGAQAIARMIPETPEGFVPPLHYAKGSYFDLAGRSPFPHLVYPLPSPGGLGVHLTLDLAGSARFGPDVPRDRSQELRVGEE